MDKIKFLGNLEEWVVGGGTNEANHITGIVSGNLTGEFFEGESYLNYMIEISEDGMFATTPDGCFLLGKKNDLTFIPAVIGYGRLWEVQNAQRKDL